MQHSYCFVLIRGLLRESRHWGDFTGLLQQQFPGAKILTPDIPGNGHLSGQTSPNRIAALTDALRQQLALTQPVNLIAISMGGMIAIDWMHRYPEEIQSAVLINTSAKPLSPFYHRLRWQIYPKLFKLLFAPKEQREHHILALTSNCHGNNEALLKDWQEWQRQYPVSLQSAKNQLTAAATFTLPTRPTPPMLIVNSKADRLVDYRCSQKLQEAWHSHFRQHPTAGHDLPLDAPFWLAEVIEQWLEQHT